MGEEDEAPKAEEQSEIINTLLRKPLLVDASGSSNRIIPSHPGPIDNSDLLNPDKTLKANLVESTNYEIVPEDLWTKLVEWYGVANNQQPLARKVIQVSPTLNIVEIYLMKIKCSMDFAAKPEMFLLFSRVTPVKSVDKELRLQFCIDSNSHTRLWLNSAGSTPEIIDMNKTLSEAGALHEGSCIVIETKRANARWIERNDEISKKKCLNNENEMSSYSNAKVSRLTTANKPGVCGLANLGNTCFMNSVLQCMSNCPPVTEYFLARRHHQELNKVNPLGMRGEIALAFGNLIVTMWSGDHKSTNPIQFKIQLGRFNPVFSGCQQHDSQELLTFLLDGLHEDLNRIKQKPYTVINDDSDREDKILAQEAWDRHRKRNNSIIVDTFHGLLKSRVVCPDCKKLSITFDPFCNLSLPLPQKKDRHLSVTYIPFEGSEQNFKCHVNIPRQCIIKDLCREVGIRTSTDPNTLLVAEMNHSHFHKFYCSDDTLDMIQDRDQISVYQMPAHSNDIESKQLVPVCFWEINENSDKFDHKQLFGVPFFIFVPKEPIDETELRMLLLEKMMRHFKIPSLNGFNCMDTDNGSLDFANKVLQDCWFRIYTKNTALRTFPTPLDFKMKKINLMELFDAEESSEAFFGRNIMLLGFTKELMREVYIEKPIELLHDKSANYRTAGRDNEKISVYDCLSLFTTCEKLGADDAWYCPTCKKHQRATKKFDLWDLPKILIVHLKRFSYTRVVRDKIDAMVECPLKNLDMSQYLIKRDQSHTVYNLIGVCNHYGNMGGGHYTASCKNKDTGEWYSFDDSSVQPISEDSVLTRAAYVLFYMAGDVQ